MSTDELNDVDGGLRQRKKNEESESFNTSDQDENYSDLEDISDDDLEDDFQKDSINLTTGRKRVDEVKATIQEEKDKQDLLNGPGSNKNISFQTRLGTAVQRPEMQVIMLILIIIDVVAALLQIFLTNGIIPGAKSSSMLRLSKFLEYESAVTIMIFMIEMLVAILSFGFSLLSHPGYTLDLVIVISQIYFSAVYDSVGVRLLGVLRLWRLLRLVDKILEDEKDAHAYTLEQLDRDRARVDDLLAQLREKDHSLKRETERLNRANEMLRNYKDDNAWLVDALHIAAEHAAGAGTSMNQASSSVPVSALRGMEINGRGSSGSNASSTPASAAPKKGTKSKRPKIKIGKDGVQRLVRE